MPIPDKSTVPEVCERLSYISSTQQDHYANMKTPTLEEGKGGAQDVEGNALRAGGALDLRSKEAFGLLAQYAAVGILYGTLPGLSLPVYQYYLNMESYQVASAAILINIPWSFKLFMGIISDCFPICGYKRRPYMVIGWGLCALMCALMVFIPIGDPFYTVPEYRQIPKTQMTPEQVATLNYDAKDRGTIFIMLSMFASIGYVIADVAADAMVVEYAQREPEEIRGRTQTAIYFVRTVFTIFAAALYGFCLNDERYNGSFSFALTMNQIMIILAIAAVCIVPISWFYIKEEKSPAKPIGQYLADLWELMKKRVMWQILIFRFVSNIFYAFGATPASAIAYYWARVEPINESISGIVGHSLFALTLYMTGKYGLNWNWRTTIAITTIAVLVVDAIVSFLTIWNVVRSQWFYVGVPLAEQLPGAIRFIISTYVCVEVADIGSEGAVYGLITTVSNLANPFSSVIYKFVDSFFDVSNEHIKQDTLATRTEVTYVYLIAYVMKLLSIGWLVLLPPQKAAVQELKRKGGSSKAAGLATMILFAFALSFSLATNIMSIFPETKCLRIVGGPGCGKKKN